jgi:transcriptional regulator with XRE-family HTH domain
MVANRALAEWLRRELRARNLSAREASLQAGLNKDAISSYLRGTRPSPDSCRKLAAYFGVPETFILGLAGHLAQGPEELSTSNEFSAILAELSEFWRQFVLKVAREALLADRRERTGGVSGDR